MNMKCSGGKRKLKNTNSDTQNLCALNVSLYIPFKTKQKPVQMILIITCVKYK